MTLFGHRLKYLRKRANLTQEEFGKILNVSASSIGMYERGSREPAYKLLIEIASYFEVSTDYLLGHTQDNKNYIFHPKLSQSDEDILQLKLEYPELFKQLKQATHKDIEKYILLLR